MRFISVKRMKEAPDEVLKELKRGGKVVLTERGKPFAAIVPISEKDLEDAALESHPILRKFIEERAKEAEENAVSWEEVKRRFGL